MNHDMTFCCNMNCPFRDCDRHLIHVPPTAPYVSMANFDGTCHRYISNLVHELEEGDSNGT